MAAAEKDFQFGGYGASMMRCTCNAKYIRLGSLGPRFRDWYTEAEVPEGKCLVCGADLERRYEYLLADWEGNLV